MNAPQAVEAAGAGTTAGGAAAERLKRDFRKAGRRPAEQSRIGAAEMFVEERQHEPVEDPGDSPT